MASQAIFIVKLLIVSAVLSVAIKEIAPHLAISATITNVLTAVLLPTIVLAIAFLFRYVNINKQKIS